MIIIKLSHCIQCFLRQAIMYKGDDRQIKWMFFLNEYDDVMMTY